MNNTWLIRGGTVCTPDGMQQADLLVDNGCITAVGEGLTAPGAQEVDATGLLVMPGFIDIHTHGAVGVDMNGADKEGLAKVSAFFASQGVTGFLPTLLTDSHEALLQYVHTIGMAAPEITDGAAVLGIHMEGPYLCAEYKGAMPEHLLQTPDFSKFMQYQKASGGRIRRMTVSPEVEGVSHFIPKAVAEGVSVSIGHSGADYDTAWEAIRSGAARRKEGKYCLSDPSYDADALAKDPALEIAYLVAPPRMAYYEKVSRQVYGVYLRYIAPEDIVVYSIDEVFIDATPYLDHYKMTARELAKTMIREVLYTTGITATAGIGTNLYLAKLAMDITAKHAAPDQDGMRIAELDEESFRYLLWDHRPLTDFWQVGPGTVRRLEHHGIHTMGELARASVQCEDLLYQEFGVNAEILIDHAWGLEPCGMKEINAYRPESSSLCEGQVLSSPYPYEKARIVVQEMVDSMVYQLTDKGLVTDGLTLDIGYDRENCDTGGYRGPVQMDRYGRRLPKPAHSSTRLEAPSNLGSQLSEAVLKLFDQIANPKLTVRRLTLTANRVVKDQGIFQTDFFTDTSKLEKEKSLQETLLDLKKKFGKNAVLKGTNYLEGATMRDRNGRIGGHKAE